MAEIELILPAMGEGIIEATLVNWLKNEGDTINIDENVIEVATDKVNNEVASDTKGVLIKKLYKEEDVIQVGKPYALISSESSNASSPTQEPVKEDEKELESVKEVEIKAPTPEIEVSTSVINNDGFLSPLVMSIIKEENITNEELASINGTGKEGRITKDDIKSFLSNRGRGKEGISIQNANNESNQLSSSDSNKVGENFQIKQEVSTSQSQKNADILESSSNENVEVVKMDRMRKLIASHMINSIQTSAHVCSFVEADVTNLVNWRNKNKDKFQEKYGEKLTFTPILIEAVVKAIIDFPNINASIDGDNLLIKKNINIGMAAALPDGNLIVPVIKNADQLNMMGLARKVNDLGARSKKNQLKPDEISEGTYTVTNLGSFGNLFGTPIINQPQVAILGLGAIVKKPIIIESEVGDQIAVRSMMYLSHSYDHRVVDGFLGGSFVMRVKQYLEDFDYNRQI